MPRTPSLPTALAALLIAALAVETGAARAATPADCVTLLNEVYSAVSRIKDWQGTDGVTVTAMGDNGPAIDRITKDLERARAAYDTAIACANQREVRSHASYGQVQPRFAKDFPRFQKAIQEAGNTAAVFQAALDIDNGMRALLRRIAKADPAAHDAEQEHANKALAAALASSKSNPFLTDQWHKKIEGAVHGNLAALKANKGKQDKAQALAAIRAAAVVGRLQGFTKEDAADPRKVTKAFEQTPVTSWFALPMGKSYVFHRYAPVERTHPVESNLAMSYPGDKKPTTPAFVFYNQKTTFVRYLKDELPRMKAPIPGLVWDASDDKAVIFVSASGGRYVTSIHHVVPAAEVAASVARATVNAVLVHDDVVALSSRGVLPAKLGATMAAAQDAYRTCAKKVWTAHDKAFEKIANADILPTTRRNRRMTLDGEVRKKVDRKCGAQQRKYAAAWDKAMGEYANLRAATLQANAVRLAELAP